ncbi:MAG: hypothetical protein V1936_02810 [Patescibacteria group bacterium]
MKSTKKPFLANHKLQFVIVGVFVAILILVGSRLESRNLKSELPIPNSALAIIQAEAAKVKAARDSYFESIGKGNDGAYDAYQAATDCPGKLAIRLDSLKNLRNDLQRLIGEIVVRERENQAELPKGTIERELQVIERELRPQLLLNQTETIEAQLQAIEKEVQEQTEDAAKTILDRIGEIRTGLTDVPTTSELVKKLDAIDEQALFLGNKKTEAVKTSSGKIREVLDASEKSVAIREIVEDIRRVVSHDGDTKLIENDLQKIEAKIPTLSQTQQKTIQGSVDEIRKLINRKDELSAQATEVQAIKTQMKAAIESVLPTEELETIKKDEANTRLAFQQSTARFENCMKTYEELDKCNSEAQDWVQKKEAYQTLILKLQNTLAEKKIEAENKLAPYKAKIEELTPATETQNFSPDLGAFLKSIQPKNLKATVVYDDTSDYWDTYNTNQFLTVVAGLISGAQGALSAGIGIIAAATGLSIDVLLGMTSSAIVFDGPSATEGLQYFRDNYSGNSYGSAIGMITGWTNFMLPFVSVIAIAALIYAGFLYLTAMGNDEQTKKAKKILVWVVLGIVIIFSAYAIVNTVLSGNSGA